MTKRIIMAMIAAVLALSSCGYREAPEPPRPEACRGAVVEYVKGVYILKRQRGN